MRRGIRRLVMLGLGWTFVLLGVLGLFLPILQGILFLAIGAVILAGESARARLIVRRLRDRYPRFGKALEGARLYVANLRRRFSMRRRRSG